jgi:hypothetical protein
MEELETLNILLPSDKFTLQWINLASNVEVLNIHNNIFDEPRKITKKERAPKIDTKNSKKDLLLMACKNDLQQFTMIWNERRASIYRGGFYILLILY